MSKDKLKYYLKLLQIEEYADIVQIKAAYRKAAKIYHPDKSDNKEDTEVFKEVKAAHDTFISIRETKRKGSLLTHTQKTVVNRQRKPNLQKEKVTYHDIIQSRKFWAVSLTALNVFLIIRIGFNTLITPLQLFMFVIGLCVLSIPFYKFTRKLQIIFIGHFALPFLLANFLLLINFLVSNNPTKEIHYFEAKTIMTSHGEAIKRNESTLVVLKNEAYKDYPGIRLHFDLRPLLYTNAVVFIFETGVFGIKVLKKSSPIFYKKVKQLVTFNN